MSTPPTIEDMVFRAEELLPRLRERAKRTEQRRSLPPETIQDFLDAGLLRVLQPARYGGYQLDYGRTQVKLCNVLGRACGSSAWFQSVIACHDWCLGMFAREAQDAVWEDDPDTLIASAFAFTTGRGRPVEGGYYVEGDWQFSSGSNACQWIILGTPIHAEAGQPTRRLWTLLPRRDWDVVDTWRAAGLKGTASNDIRVNGAFVPHKFTVASDEFDGRPTPGSLASAAYIYRLPLWAVFPYNVSTPALGIARGALQAAIESLSSQSEGGCTTQRQLRIAESGAEIDAAEALWLADATEIERRGQTFGPWPTPVLARIRRDLAYATQLCARAVDRLALAAGACGLFEDTPLQRAQRDVHAVANHGANNWDLMAIPFAREVLGLPAVSVR